MGVRGTVRVLPNGDVEWKIPDLEPPLMKNDFRYSSPHFVFGGEKWCFWIELTGRRESNSTGDMDVALVRCSSGAPLPVQFSLALKTVDGQKCSGRQEVKVFNEFCNRFQNKHFVQQLLSIADYKRRKSEFLMDGCFTIVCTMKIVNEECSTSDPRFKRPRLSEGSLLQKCCDHECKAARAEDVSSLGPDFKKALLNGTNHDVIVKVGNKELGAHQDILKARSRVFESMLSHDMVEKNSRIINAPDCDPEAMEQFLLYVYSGKVEKLNETNMLTLYYIADKYEMEGLKKECCDLIKYFLSPTNLCNVIQLAVNHSDSSLLDCATEYFTNHLLDILRTVEWQSFLKDNPTVANELFIKSQEKKK